MNHICLNLRRRGNNCNCNNSGLYRNCMKMLPGIPTLNVLISKLFIPQSFCWKNKNKNQIDFISYFVSATKFPCSNGNHTKTHASPHLRKATNFDLILLLLFHALKSMRNGNKFCLNIIITLPYQARVYKKIDINNQTRTKCRHIIAKRTGDDSDQ